MTDQNHDVISAFLDNEPFDATDLADALAQPDGRELLLDLIALRGVVQPEPTVVPTPARGRSALRLAMAVAGIVIALGAGYQWGATAESRPIPPPEPSRVVVSEGPWQDVQ